MTEVKVPSVGESITSGVISAWHKKDGESVNAGDKLYSLETEKISTEITAEVSGKLQIKAKEGQEVKIGEVIATIDESAKAEKAPEKGAPAPADSTSALSEGPPNVHQLPGRKASARHKASTTAAGPDQAGPPKVGAIWLAVPLGILALIVVLPLSIGTYFWLRSRRAAAEYRRSRA